MNWPWICATYCAAHFGKSLLWTASDLLTLYLLVAVYALDPMTAGWIFLIGLTANAVADLGAGIWLSRRPSDAAWLAGVALAAAAFAFPATVLTAGHGPWALLAATLAFRIAYAGCDVPHNALLTRLGDTPGRAIALSRGRTLGTVSASLIAASAAGGTAAPATLVWSIAVAGWLIGSAMVPLLRAFPLSPVRLAKMPTSARWLPASFLIANVIGIVALAALAKAALHLPAPSHPDMGGTAILMWMILGRTLSAVVPMRMETSERGLAILAVSYVAGGIVAAGFAWSAAPPMLVALGFVMGATNLVGWTLLPLLGVGPRGYGLYAMVSKFALGVAGLALAGGLGRVPNFSMRGYIVFVLVTAAACFVAAGILTRRLTWPGLRGLSV